MSFIEDTLGGVANIFTGSDTAEATAEAAELQASAAELGVAESARQFDVTEGRLEEAEQFGRSQIQPFQQAGVRALNQQQALSGLFGTGFEEEALSRIRTSPGQDFIRRRAEKAVLRNASAIGGLGGGNVQTALAEQAAGFASQDIANQFGRLSQISGQGQTAGTNLGVGAAGTASTLGQFGLQATTEANRQAQAAAEARASGILGAQQARSQGTQNIADLASTAAFAAFSDERLKTEITKIDEDEIGGIYTFKYLGSDNLYQGRMAQELLHTRPNAVLIHESGYLQVTAEFAPEAVKWH